MSLNDQAVLTAALGYIFVAPTGTAAPSPSDIKTLDPLTFGAKTTFAFKVTGAPTGGTFTVSAGGTASAPLAYNASADQIRQELEKLTEVGAGNVVASGAFTDTGGIVITLVGKLLDNTTIAFTTVTTGLTGGTTPSVTATKAALPSVGGWENIGHTSRDDLPEFGFDGGDSEVKGSWQNAALREVVTEQAADYVTMRLLQFDAKAMELYYGPNKSSTKGVFGVADGTQVPVEKALFILIVDGAHKLGFHSPKTSIQRDDSIELAVDEFAVLPIRATFMSSGSPIKYSWISELI